MTMHKHLKERVRARMQKTGETYTTARRHVLNKREIESATTDDPLLRWHFAGNIPATTALRVIATHAGLRNPNDGQPFSEPLLFLLAGGIGIGMFAFFYEKANFASFFVAGRHNWFDDQGYLQNALDRFGMKSRIFESSGRKPAEKQLHDALAREAPCVAWVDMGSLPHRGMPEKMKGCGYHVVTVYKQDGDNYIIGDLTDQPLAVPAADFMNARLRIKKQKNRVLTVEPGKREVELSKLVRDGLQACATGLVEAKMGGMKTNFRLEALTQWAERLHGSKDKESWDRIFAAPQNFWTALTSIYNFIEAYGTGGGLCRTIFAEGLNEASAALGDKKLTVLAERYAELGREWSALADAALPMDVPEFAEARTLMTRRAELSHDGGPAEQIREVWAKLGELESRVKSKFPLNDAARVDLCAALQTRVRRIRDAEVSAHKALQEAL